MLFTCELCGDPVAFCPSIFRWMVGYVLCDRCELARRIQRRNSRKEAQNEQKLTADRIIAKEQAQTGR
jgi:hypothetical protein